MGRQPKETPREAFERLRDCFDAIREKHSDPWNWHEYLGPDPDPTEEEEDEPDPEIKVHKPKKRSNLERLKVHLLASIAELNRAAGAADVAYFHMCVNSKDYQECCRVLGSSGDIDEELLEQSGDASPAKIMAGLQRKLDIARERISELETEVRSLQETLQDTLFESEERRSNLELMSMNYEEALARLNFASEELHDSMLREDGLQMVYDDLHIRWVRASRLMLFKGRELLRDKVFKANPRENQFYAFHGFMYVLQTERDERKKRQDEARRDAVEFALRNEVRFMLGESARRQEAVERLTCETGRLKLDRRELSCRILYKHRPQEPLEYCLWVWELWVVLRPQLVLEKDIENEQDMHAAAQHQLFHTSSQLYPAARTIDRLKKQLAEVSVDKDLARREITFQTSSQLARLVEGLQGHRVQELSVLQRLHDLDVEDKLERIAMLEKEIAEDKHIQALKGMVIDLESRLRKALDWRKQRSYVVPPGTGHKCVSCGREDLLKSWKVVPSMADKLGAMEKSASLGELASSRSLSALGELTALRLPTPGPGPLPPPGYPPAAASLEAPGEGEGPWSVASHERVAKYTAVWR